MSASSMAMTATSLTGSAPRRAKRSSTVHDSRRPSAPVTRPRTASAAAISPTATSTRARRTDLLAGAQVRATLDEERDEPRIEVPAGEAPQLGERLVDGPSGLVRAVGDERVVDVADRADPRDERDLV